MTPTVVAEILSDHSLLLTGRVRDADAGEYAVRADNGIGDAVVEIVEVIVFPLSTKANIVVDKTLFRFDWQRGGQIILDYIL